ncbi:hypothetical protein BH23THE1_BH23THE1_25130 [soil metagenome]
MGQYFEIMHYIHLLKTFLFIYYYFTVERGKVSQLVLPAVSKNLVTVILLLLIVASIIDTSIIKLSVFIGGVSPISNIFVLSLLVVVYAVGQYFILHFVKTRIDIRKMTPLGVIHKIVSGVQYLLIVSSFIIILQMILTSSYNLLLLKLIVCTSCGLSVGLLGYLAYKFFSWSRVRHDAIVILYAVAMGMMTINIFFMVASVLYGLSPQSDEIRPIRNPVAAVINAENTFNSLYVTSSILSFILIWIPTVLLLRYYSKKFGRAKYWIIVSAPLFYFFAQYQALFFNLFDSFRLSDPTLFGIVFTLIFTMSKPIGGILFGVAFWVVSRMVSKHEIRYYLIVAAFGLILLFTSNQATSLIYAPYPPFGLVTVSLLGLSSYLLLVGVYSSAMSISRDRELRKFISTVATKEIKWLDHIGSVQVENELIKRVVPIVQNKVNKIEQETGIKPSLTDDDIKQYLNDVIAEVKNFKNT